MRLYYDEDREAIDTYHTDPKMSIDNIEHGISLVRTGQILKYLDILKSLLVDRNEEHFLLVGPHGSAKRSIFCIKIIYLKTFQLSNIHFRLMVQHALGDRSDVEIVEINCSSNLSTNYIMHKLQQVIFILLTTI